MREFAREDLKTISGLGCLAGGVLYLFSAGLGYIFFDTYGASSFYWIFGVVMTGGGVGVFLALKINKFRYCTIYIKLFFMLYFLLSSVYLFLFIGNFNFFFNIAKGNVGLAYFLISLCLMVYWFVDGVFKYKKIIRNARREIIKEINTKTGHVFLSDKILKEIISRVPIWYPGAAYVCMSIFFGSIIFFMNNGLQVVFGEAKLFVMMVLSFPFCHLFLKLLSWVICCFHFSITLARETGCTPYVTD